MHFQAKYRHLVQKAKMRFSKEKIFFINNTMKQQYNDASP